MREQREVLEHEPDPALLRRHEALGSGDLLAVEQDAARGRALDACGDPEQGRLAAARRPQQAEDLRRRDVEADLVEREDVAIAARLTFNEAANVERTLSSLSSAKDTVIVDTIRDELFHVK